MGTSKLNEMVVADPGDDFVVEYVEIAAEDLVEIQDADPESCIELADGSDIHDQVALDRELAEVERILGDV